MSYICAKIYKFIYLYNYLLICFVCIFSYLFGYLFVYACFHLCIILVVKLHPLISFFRNYVCGVCLCHCHGNFVNGYCVALYCNFGFYVIM